MIKTTGLRTRQFKIVVFFYYPVRGSTAIDCAGKNPRSRTRRVGSGHQVLGKGAISSGWPYYVEEFGGFLCFTFFVVSLLCNLNKIL